MKENVWVSGLQGADSVFHSCQRDAGIAFPKMVKGYLCQHRCGLSDDQRAVVLGRTGGKYLR